MPTISIIVPVYNVENYLVQCVQSLLAQTIIDIEILLIDDGSKDRSGAICDELAEKDNRVVVIHKPNGGVSAARNTGIEHARGQYICFCDSDDYAEPTWCEHLLNQIKAYPKSWCFCGCHVVDANGVVVEKDCVFHDQPLYETLPIIEYDQVYQTNYAALLWNRIFNAEIIRKQGLRFDEKMSLSEDVLFNLEYGKNCDKFAIVNKALYYHRMYYNNEADHLDGKLPSEMFYTNSRIYTARKHFIQSEQMTTFETNFFYRFIEDIRCIARNASLVEQQKRNKIREILKSKEFRTAMRNADTSKENWKLLLMLRLSLSTMVLQQFR